MKQETTLNMLIDRIEASKVNAGHPNVIDYANNLANLLRALLIMERQQLEKAFEDGVGEGMTDPERPLSGKEYYDIKFKQ